MRMRERHLFFSSKDNRTVLLTREDFLPDRTADGDLLFTFSRNILDFQRSLLFYLKFGSRYEGILRFYCQQGCSLFQAFRQWGAVRRKKEREKIKAREGAGGGERGNACYRFVLNIRPLRPHQLQVVFTCQSRLMLQIHTFIIFLANKSKFLGSKINIMYT